MNTKHVTSLEISKQLAEAGIMIESEYVWYTNGDNAHLLHTPDGMRPMASKTFSAPIATEILDVLPDGCEYGVNLVKLMSGYGVELTSYKTMPYDRLEFIQDKNPCDALALLLIRLTKDGLI